MEFLRLGDAILRSSSPLLPFLAPAVYRPAGHRLASVGSLYNLRPIQCHAQFSYAASRRAESDTLPREAPSKSSSDDIASLLDGVLDSARRPSKSSSNPSRFARPGTRSLPHISSRDRDAGAVDELLQMMKPPSQESRARRPLNNQPSPFDLGSADIAKMLDPSHDLGLSTNSPVPAPSLDPPPMKLNSSVGRVVNVQSERGMDVGRAFRTLDMQCARNRVKRDAQTQRFHERPGMKRKRLKSERWRRRFKEDFVHTVQMVKKMRKQGW